MDGKRLGALLFCVILLLVPVTGKVDTSIWGGKPKPDLNLERVGAWAMDPLELIKVANVGEDFGLDSNAMWRPADEWNRRAVESEKQLKKGLCRNPRSHISNRNPCWHGFPRIS
jgi:hypothetical protein